MAVKNLLALDLGAESGRAILGRFDGARLELSEKHRFANTPIAVPGQGAQASLHWDVLRLWSDVRAGVVRAAREEPVKLDGIGLDTWGVDFGLLDRRGQLISSPYHYRDNRTDGMVEEAFQRVPREQIFAQTGIQFMQINSLYQLFSMVIQRAPALEIAHTFLTIPDLFNYWLTGTIACEFTNATTTQCYNPRLHTWADPLLAGLGIPREIFPEVIQPGTTIGPLHKLLADEIGGPAMVIAPAVHDTGSAVAAVPASAPGFAWISSGTWSIVGIELPEPVINAQSLANNFTNEGGVSGTMRFCKNVMGLWLVQECRRTWRAAGEEHSYADLVEMAKTAPALRSLVDPDDGDFLKPGDMPSRIQAYCRRTGQPVPESKAAIIRCALESIALKYRWVLDRIEEMTGKPMDTIHIVGGGTQNLLLNQFTADATGKTVITGPVEATAAGNILMQAVALDLLGSIWDAREVVRQSFETHTYEPAPSAAWQDGYQRLQALIK